MPPLDLPMMPMARAAAPLDLGATAIPPLSLSGGAPPLVGPPPMAPAPIAPQPEAAPYSVKLQRDGSSVYYLRGPIGDGSDDIILAVNKAPKLPPALQAPDAGKAAAQ